MINSRITLAVGIGLYVLVTASAILQQVVLVPVFSAYWDEDLYGSWLIIFSTGALLIVADCGLNPLTYNRLQAEVARQDGRDSTRICTALANSLFAYRAIFAGVLIAIPAIAFLLPIPKALGLSGASDLELRLAFLIAMVGSASTIPIVGLSALLRVTHRINSISAIRIINAVTAMTLMYLAISAGFGIVAVACAYAAANIIEMLVMNFILAPRALKEFASVRIEMRDERFGKTLRHALKFLVPVSADTVVQSIPTFVMGIIALPSVGIVVYTLGRVVTSCIRQVAIAVMFAFSSSIGYAWTRGDKAEAARTVAICLAVAGSATGAAIGYFWSYHPALVHIWTGGTYEADSVVFALLFGSITAASPGIVAWHALLFTGAPAAITKAKGLQVLVLVVLCAFSGSVLGVRGVAASVFLSELVVVSIPLSVELMRRFPLGWHRFVASTTAPFVAMFALSYLCAEAAQRLQPPNSLWTFGTSSALWVPAPCAAILLVFYFSTRKTGELS